MELKYIYQIEWDLFHSDLFLFKLHVVPNTWMFSIKNFQVELKWQMHD